MFHVPRFAPSFPFRPAALCTLLVGSALATPLGAQDLPAGWEVRADQGGHQHGGGAPEGLMFESIPPGWQVTTGPAVILWQPITLAEGDFRVEVETHLFDPNGRREGFGVILGGSDLHGDAQRYSYVLLRDGGEFLVKKRSGADTPTVVGWTRHSAIRSWVDRADGGASVLNSLVVEARGEQVRILVNGTEVTTVPRSQVDTRGIVGLRVNHGLKLHVSRFEVSPLD